MVSLKYLDFLNQFKLVYFVYDNIFIMSEIAICTYELVIDVLRS